MPRTARKQSATGFYHIIIRGIGKQIIFENDGDREFLLRTIRDVLLEEGVSLLAWCLMNNHIHLAVRAEHPVGKIMQRINTKYAIYFNARYDRMGHLFQNRFWSEAIESEKYLCAVVRYIHQNPVREGMCNVCSEYRWSSYSEYLTGGMICSTSIVLNVFGGKKEFEDAHMEPIQITELSEKFPGGRGRLSDEQAGELIKTQLGENILSEVRQMKRYERNRTLFRMKELGLPCRQIQRLTGIGYNIVVNIQEDGYRKYINKQTSRC